MKLTDKQIKRLVATVFQELKSQNIITFKDNEEKILQRGIDIIKGDFAREARLDQEVNKMMDDLERQNPGGFERYKMFPLLKKRLAKEKGIIL
jgi:hypothetical protein